MVTSCNHSIEKEVVEGCYRLDSGEYYAYGHVIFSVDSEYYEVQYNRYGDRRGILYAGPSLVSGYYINSLIKIECPTLYAVSERTDRLYTELGVKDNIIKVLKND